MGNGFLEMLCNFYIVILAVALPLYTGGSYWQLGDVTLGADMLLKIGRAHV